MRRAVLRCASRGKDTASQRNTGSGDATVGKASQRQAGHGSYSRT
jgi:hypothetical protein